MKNDNGSRGKFFKYLFSSLLIHLVILFLFSTITAGIQPAFQSQPTDKVSQLNLIHLEEEVIDESDYSTKVDEEVVDEVEEDEEEELEEDLKEGDLEELQEEPKDEIEEVAGELEEESEQEVVQEEVGSEEKIIEDEAEDIPDEPTIDEDQEEESEDILTSEDSTEEVKVSEGEGEEKQKEKDSTKEENEEIKEGEEVEGEEVKEEAKEDPPPPPVAQDMIFSNIIPSYPKNAANAGVEGEVELLVRVSADGSIQGVDIVESSQNQNLDNVAKLTVERGWEFEPYNSDYSIRLLVTFEDRNHVDVKYLDLSFEE
ncbi:energy transducer TonB [Halonatronum saccharophilum]|uniref:energy transducer TonB n=1 Tax=Halonatronum saccharophilum TaxID=150060 RepID=UPI000487F46E|nr:TonB family protein [Halonatronum saccharophilum]